MMDELALLEAWQAGSSDAGSKLLRRYASVVYHFFLTKTDAATAEELAQETFEVCSRQRANIRPPATARAYLLGIARRKLLQHHDEWRRRGSRHQPLEGSVDGGRTTPSAVIAREGRQQLVLAALRELPLDCQIVVELFYWEELTVVEIGQVLEIPSGTVKSRLSRARQMLSEQIVALSAGGGARAEGDVERWLGAMQQARRAERGPGGTDG